jgi:RsiW-degrading membrane proteinase PrsW (M82 family)
MEASVPLQRPVAPRPAAAPVRRVVRAQEFSAKPSFNFHYLLGLALIPLIIMTIHPPSDTDAAARFSQALKQHPEILEKMATLPRTATPPDVIALLPDRRVEGAFLPADTWVHWLFAIASGAAFFGLVMLIFPNSIDNPVKVLGVGLFTATVGIFMLLTFQRIAMWTQHFILIGGGLVAIGFYLIRFIGFSYWAAADPSTSFATSCLAFILGVGMCEELCKSAPLLYHYTTDATMRWRTACMLGLASGFGFGVSEAVHYSTHLYNGLLGADIYWIRFISCVALHGFWSGGAAISIYRRQKILQESGTAWDWLANAGALMVIPMILHGLYDTLLKKHFGVLALAVAIGSFGWFCAQVEYARRNFDAKEEAVGE